MAEAEQLKHTPLIDQHRRAGARLVDFAGWAMPLHYGSQVEEHHQVRRHAGMFDVSHMTVVDVGGAEARPYLRTLIANDIARLQPGQALYGCMLNARGGVVDDLIVYDLGEGAYRVVVNAATRDKDLEWMSRHAEGRAVALAVRDDLAMIAIQGPRACELTLLLLPQSLRAAARELPPFHAAAGRGWFVARTGYTGEDGFEVMLPAEAAADFWETLREAGVAPAGLGARDTLRLEAGMALYGQDMDEDTTPLESGLGWTVAWEPQDRDFIGREALEAQRAAGVSRKRVGLVLEGRGVIRSGMVVHTPQGEGRVTSGGFSPTLGQAIALARVPAGVGPDTPVTVEIRGRRQPARVVRPPFVRHGKPCL